MTTSENSTALKIESAGTAVLFLTTYDPTRVNMNVKSCCSFGNVTGTDPTSASIVTPPSDGSYALYVRLKDLAAGESDEFAWYYAAGPSSQINAIIAEAV